jgi:hypothetical protein
VAQEIGGGQQAKSQGAACEGDWGWQRNMDDQATGVDGRGGGAGG